MSQFTNKPEAEGGSPGQPNGTTPLPDAAPPEKFSSLVGEYPGVAIVAGLGLGILAGALLPRKAGRKAARGVTMLAAAAGELGLALGRQALEKAEDGREMFDEAATSLTRMAGDARRSVSGAAQDAAATARETGHDVQRMANDASKSAREAGIALARKAVDTVSRLRH